MRRPRFRRHPGDLRPWLDRRHHLLALHQRRDLPRPEDGPRRLRQQQRRHLRPRLPLADRLRPEDHLRHLGRHPGLRFGRQDRRGHGDRRQPDRRPPGVRLAHEEAAARRRQADRRRSAPDRPRPHAARRGRAPPAAAARHQRRGDQRARACRSSPRAWSTRPSSRERCDTVEFALAPRSSPSRATAPEAMEAVTGVPAAELRAAARLYATGGNARDLLRPRRHRAQPGLDHGHGAWRTSRWRPAISAGPASA